MQASRRLFGGVLVRRECWTISLRGWALVFLIVLLGVLALARGLYPFLAVTTRTSGEVMVIESWIHSHSIEQAASEYKSGQYQAVLVVKAVYPVVNKWESGLYMPEYIAATMIRLGVPKDRVHLVLCDVLKKDRTYYSALAVRKWLQQCGMTVESIDVVTLGPHARRSRILFQKAFRDELKVGVIAMDEKAYDPAHWWRSSEGVREVLFEGIAYLYATWFFHPRADRDLDHVALLTPPLQERIDGPLKP